MGFSMICCLSESVMTFRCQFNPEHYYQNLTMLLPERDLIENEQSIPKT